MLENIAGNSSMLVGKAQEVGLEIAAALLFGDVTVRSGRTAPTDSQNNQGQPSFFHDQLISDRQGRCQDNFNPRPHHELTYVVGISDGILAFPILYKGMKLQATTAIHQDVI